MNKFIIVLIILLTISTVSVQTKCPEGYTELNNQVVDIYSKLQTVCVLSSDYVRNCTLYSVSNIPFYSAYQIVSISDLTCISCNIKNSFFIINLIADSGEQISACISSDFNSLGCSQYSKVINSFSTVQYYQCSKCPASSPFFLLNTTSDNVILKTCSKTIKNCSSIVSIDVGEPAANGIDIVLVHTQICALCSLGYTANSRANYCMKIVDSCSSYNLVQCITCNSGYSLVQSQCVRTGNPSGASLTVSDKSASSSSSSSSSDSSSNCAQYDQVNGQCYACKDGYDFIYGDCLKSVICRENEYVNADRICVAGKTPNCGGYDNVGFCWKCKQGYQFNDNQSECVYSSNNLQRQSMARNY